MKTICILVHNKQRSAISVRLKVFNRWIIHKLRVATPKVKQHLSPVLEKGRKNYCSEVTIKKCQSKKFSKITSVK